jgi:DNA-binding NtrC family response regulator
MNHTVLLVDDDENLLSGLARAMHKQPFQVQTARTGEEAVCFLETRAIDVVVTDERMPGMSGADLLAWIACHCPAVMRIVLTGYADANMAIRVINEAGVCQFFTKPCNEARLAMAIHEAIERKCDMENQRQSLENSRRQLCEFERVAESFKAQNQIIAQDLQPLLDQILNCCRRMEEQSGEQLDRELYTLLAAAQKAADDAGRLVASSSAMTET